MLACRLRYWPVPEANGKLTEAERAALQTWLREHWTDLACPFHGRTTWDIGDLVQTLPYNPGAVVVGGNVYPLVVVTCVQCGFTALVNALIAHILPPAPPAAPAAET